MASFSLRVMTRALPFLLVVPALAPAQTPPSRAEAMAAMQSGPQKTRIPYTRQQIDQLIAPIALYPDQLLAPVLMAATFPQQLLEAARWLDDPQHAALEGEALARELEPLPWDPSVKTLIAFPQIIAMLTEHLEWTESLGLAFATQQAQVMQRVQALRQLAVRSGRIRNVKHVTVRNEDNVILIAPAEPERVFVPIYDPMLVYGAWPARDYPPIYVAPPPRFVTETHTRIVETVAPGFVLVGYPVVAPLWGWTAPDWRNNQITIRTNAYTRITRDARPAPDGQWRRKGRMVLVTPPVRRSERPDPVPAGTIAPARAAVVTALPRRAAAQPDRVRVESAPMPGRFGGDPTAGTQPGASRPEAVPIDRSQAGKGSIDPVRAEKMTAPQPQPAEPRAPSSTAASGPAPGPAAEQPRPHPHRAERTPAPQPHPASVPSPTMPSRPQPAQAESGQRQLPRAERPQAKPTPTQATQTQQPQPEKTPAHRLQADMPHPAARSHGGKSPAEAASGEPRRAPGHAPATAAVPPDPGQNRAGAMSGRRSPAMQAPGEGTSQPHAQPPAAAAPRAHAPAAAGHRPPHPQADPGAADRRDR
jgi:hypothetical protein